MEDVAFKVLGTIVIFWVFFLFAAPIRTLTITYWIIAPPLALCGIWIAGMFLLAIWS